MLEQDWSELGLPPVDPDTVETLKSLFEGLTGCPCVVVHAPSKHSEYTVVFQGRSRTEDRQAFRNIVRPVRVRITSVGYLVRAQRQHPPKVADTTNAWMDGGSYDRVWLQEWRSVRTRAITMDELDRLAQDSKYWANAFLIRLFQEGWHQEDSFRIDGVESIARFLSVSTGQACQLACTRISTRPARDFPFLQMADQVECPAGPLFELWKGWDEYHTS